MGSGYVLNFSNRTFSEFFDEHTHIDIDATTYRERGTSKANRLRSFWTIEGNHVVGKAIEAMILYGESESCLCNDQNFHDLSDDCRKIAKRLLLDTPVAELDALTATGDERDFERVAQHVREAIEKTNPRPRWIGYTPLSLSTFARFVKCEALRSIVTRHCIVFLVST